VRARQSASRAARGVVIPASPWLGSASRTSAVVLLSRLRAVGRALLRLITSPFTGEMDHPRESSEEAEQRLREMTLRHRDRSR
jgi:hypothetical protein